MYVAQIVLIHVMYVECICICDVYMSCMWRKFKFIRVYVMYVAQIVLIYVMYVECLDICDVRGMSLYM